MFQRDPLNFLMGLQRHYGDVAQFRLLIWPIYVFHHPDYINYILQENYPNYDKNAIQFRVVGGLLGNGLVTAVGGESWLRQRRLMQPAFHRQRIAALGTLMTAATTAMLEHWEAAYERQDKTFDVADEMAQLTTQIVSKALFSKDMGGAVSTFWQAWTQITEFSIQYFLMPFPPVWVPVSSNRRFKEALQTLDTIAYGIIRERRTHNEDRGDLLSMLISTTDEETGESMNDQQLRDQIVTLLLSGLETGASELTWTWYLLSQYPEVEQRLHEELNTVLGGRVPTMDDLPKLRYTRMIIDEALRMYPAAWHLMRRAVKDDEIGGYHVPANTYVLWSPYVAHRHPEFWENPEQFDPERFSPEQVAKRPRHAYMPFSSGPRMCLGSNFALTEATLILATVAQHYRLKLQSGQKIEPDPVLTLHVRNGVKVYLERCNI